MGHLVGKSIVKGLGGSIAMLVAWVAIFAGIFETQLNDWFMDLWQNNQPLCIALMVGTVAVPTVLAFLFEILTQQADGR
ncbi:MAG: hypothetical protein HC837_16680 [Chloroflexaceae bacterium]|nr:hypothetical protein [Chloroflexaceae bacterium]